MDTHSLSLEIPGYVVPAALTLPDGTPRGAALLIPGSLFSDVDGNYPTWNSFPRVYAHLAEGLAERGIATLRYAKLGPGTGSVQTDADRAPASRTWTGRANTARAALALLRHALGARGAVSGPTVLAGHSEGAVVASVLARDGIDADGVVLLSGPSVGIFGIMLEQSRVMGGSDDDQYRVLEEVVAVVRAGGSIPDDLKQRAVGPMGAGALVNFPPEALGYMRDVDATDPVAAIAAYDKPVLIVQGGADTSVPPHHADVLERGRGGRSTSRASFPELQHFYKEVPPGTPPMDAFGLPGPTDRRVDAAIAEWMRTLGEPVTPTGPRR